MHYIWNPDNNSTVLVALMNGGYITSFQISSKYYMENHKKLPEPYDPFKDPSAYTSVLLSNESASANSSNTKV